MRLWVINLKKKNYNSKNSILPDLNFKTLLRFKKKNLST